ncbi:MAG: hypothetical protein CSA38_03035 [Flavobacteriales bacterium]|nr:MAG: hypothetical protein CSA38_03035 [Flavobacteriales bacterium]
MKKSLYLKSFLLAGIFTLSSCATTKYSEQIYKNDYTHLQTGRTYKFGIKGSKLTKKLIFSRTTDTEIIGFENPKDSVLVHLQKTNVTSAKDVRKSIITTSGIVIGAAATTALIISSSKAD